MHYYNCLINIQITFCNRKHNIIYFTSRSVHIDTGSSLIIIIIIIFINLQLVNECFYKYSSKLSEIATCSPVKEELNITLVGG